MEGLVTNGEIVRPQCLCSARMYQMYTVFPRMLLYASELRLCVMNKSILSPKERKQRISFLSIDQERDNVPQWEAADLRLGLVVLVLMDRIVDLPQVDAAVALLLLHVITIVDVAP